MLPLQLSACLSTERILCSVHLAQKNAGRWAAVWSVRRLSDCSIVYWQKSGSTAEPDGSLLGEFYLSRRAWAYAWFQEDFFSWIYLGPQRLDCDASWT